jgi:uncharacterized protein involved in type VI secretion and phage assembly
MIEQSARDGVGNRQPSSSILTGVVSSNIDALAQGKVLVRLPSLDIEVWGRLSALGGGPSHGFFHPPNTGDEVLVALDQANPAQAYVLGGLWSTRDRPPVDTPVENLFKRMYRTGLADSPLGHEVEFNDAEQSVSITTSTKQKIVMNPEKIEISTSGGTVSITLNLTEQSVSIQGVVKIELSAEGEINLSAAKVSIEGTIQTDIKGGMVSITGETQTDIKGALVTIN